MDQVVRRGNRICVARVQKLLGGPSALIATSAPISSQPSAPAQAASPALGPQFCFSNSAGRPAGAAVFQPPKFDRRSGFGRLETAPPSIRTLRTSFVTVELWAKRSASPFFTLGLVFASA